MIVWLDLYVLIKLNYLVFRFLSYQFLKHLQEVILMNGFSLARQMMAFAEFHVAVF